MLVLQDALTDMHLSMEDIPVDDDNYKHLTMKVHTVSCTYIYVHM